MISLRASSDRSRSRGSPQIPRPDRTSAAVPRCLWTRTRCPIRAARPALSAPVRLPRELSAELRGEGGAEEQLFLFAEGRAEGRLSGRFRGANYPRRRTDRTAVTDMRGVLETDDGAAVLVECRGYGRRHSPEYDRDSPGGRQWVATVVHVSEHPSYRWLNDVVCVGTGQVRPKPEPRPNNPTDLVLDVAELVWEPGAP